MCKLCADIWGYPAPTQSSGSGCSSIWNLLFENGREDEKASAGGAQVFLETRAPTFNSTTYKRWYPHNIYKNMKDNVFSFMRHMFCASQVTRKPLRPWLSIRTPCQELHVFEVQGNATDFKDRKI